MTPLGRLILTAMRLGALFCAACLSIFMAIAVWQAGRGGADGRLLAILAALLAACLWLARAIGRELRNN